MSQDSSLLPVTDDPRPPSRVGAPSGLPDSALEGAPLEPVLRRSAPARQAARRPWAAGAAVAASLLLAALAGTAWGLRPAGERILAGVSVAGVAVGGMEPGAARRALDERLSTGLERTVLLVDGERSWDVTPRALGCAFDVDASVARAHAAGREGNLLRRVREGWQARRQGLALKPKRLVDREALARRLEEIAARARIPARDARVRFDGRAFLVTPERVGRAVDAEGTEKNIVRYFDPLTHRRVRLVAGDEMPRVTAADLREVDARLASYTTRFNAGDRNRTQNVRLAARALSGTVVPAGGVFSYNESVGPRLEEAGYRVAKIFLRGKILEGVGGGVCQVASTVYNAALESRLPILERARHSRPVTYVPEGRDATVSYGGVDLKFRNRTSAPILIQARVAGSSLTVSIYGNHRFRRSARQTADAGRRGESG